MNCPECGKELLTILAKHEYNIKCDKEQGKWVKQDINVDYACSTCLESLGPLDIEDILRQVDEL